MKNETNPKFRYFTSNDLLQGNSVNKLYVSLFGDVYDLTETYEKYRLTFGALLTLDFAGKDVSHFFNQRTRSPIFPDENLRD